MTAGTTFANYGVQSIDPSVSAVSLGCTPDPVVGSDESLHPLLRRWDQTSGDPAAGGLTLASDNAAFVQKGVWLSLEDGVQIRFQPAGPASAANAAAIVNQYRTADYWLIPARTATGNVEWPKVMGPQGNPETDAQGNPIPVALPPHGVVHHYAPLAVVSVGPDGVTVQAPDCRSSFDPAAVPWQTPSKENRKRAASVGGAVSGGRIIQSEACSR